jgi:tetratricopeptide (TPR) repeat protein
VQRADEKRKAAPGTPGRRHDFAVADLELAAFLDMIGRRPASIVAYNEAIGELDRLAVEFADDPRYADDAAKNRMKLASVYERDGNAREANHVSELAITSLRGRPSSDKPENRQLLANQLVDQAMVRLHTGRVEDALAATREAVAIVEGLLADPARAATPPRGWQGQMAFVTRRHADVLEQAGRLPEAEAAFAKTVALRRHLHETAAIGDWFGRGRGNADYRSTWNNWLTDLRELARFHLRCGHAEQAASLCAEIRDSLQRIVDAYPADTDGVEALARFLVTCTVVAVRDAERAVTLARKAIAHREMGRYVGTLGAAQYRTGNFRAAVANLDHANRWRPRFELSSLEEVFYRAMARWRLEEPEAARRLYEEGVRRPESRDYDVEQHRAEAAAVLGIK